MSSPHREPSDTKTDPKAHKPRKQIRAHKVHVRAGHRPLGRHSHQDHHSRAHIHSQQNGGKDQHAHRLRQEKSSLHDDDAFHCTETDEGVDETESVDDQEDDQLQIENDQLVEPDGLEPVHFVTLDDTIPANPEQPERDISTDAALYSALETHLFSHPLFAAPDATTVPSHGADDSATDTDNGFNVVSAAPVVRYLGRNGTLLAEDLTPSLLQSRCFHLICSAGRCRKLVADIVSRRKAASSTDSYSRPVFIWEPLSPLCRPNELLNCTNTLPVVDICSLHHTDLASLMGESSIDPENGLVSAAAIERYCEQLLSSMPLTSYTLVIRVDDQGCYLARNPGTRRSTKRGSKSATQRKKTPGGVGLSLDMDMESLFAGLLQEPDGTIARDDEDVDPGLDRWVSSTALVAKDSLPQS